MTRVLFIGSYLSQKYGTKDIVEKLKEDFKKEGIAIELVSDRQNKIIRIIHIVLQLLIWRSEIVVFSVFSGNAFYITRIGSLFARLRHKYIIFNLHGGALPEYAERNRHLVSEVMKRASLILTPSLYLKDCFIKLGVESVYLPNSIKIEGFPFKHERYKPFSLLWVRAFTETYNPELAVKALYETLKIFPAATLTMIGPDKGLLNETRRLINSLGIKDSVDIKGPVRNEELFHYYNSHEIYLNTTSYESFGVAVLEAAACGIPIVSSRVGEIPYLWEDRKEILMVDELKPEAFAERIIELFENRDLAERLSIAARKKAESFDWERIKQMWIKILTDN